MASVEDMNAAKAHVSRLEGIIAGLQTTMTSMTNAHNNANAAAKQVEVDLKFRAGDDSQREERSGDQDRNVPD